MWDESVSAIAALYLRVVALCPFDIVCNAGVISQCISKNCKLVPKKLTCSGTRRIVGFGEWKTGADNSEFQRIPRDYFDHRSLHIQVTEA